MTAWIVTGVFTVTVCCFRTVGSRRQGFFPSVGTRTVKRRFSTSSASARQPIRFRAIPGTLGSCPSSMFPAAGISGAAPSSSSSIRKPILTCATESIHRSLSWGDLFRVSIFMETPLQRRAPSKLWESISPNDFRDIPPMSGGLRRPTAPRVMWTGVPRPMTRALTEPSCRVRQRAR